MTTSTPQPAGSLKAQRLQLTGVSCNGCVNKIRSALQQRDPRAELEVDADLQRASLRTELDGGSAVAIIEALGYGAVEVRPQHYRLQVPGVKCAGCVATIRQALLEQDSAVTVAADLDSRQLQIETRLSAEQLLSTLEGCRYPAQELAEGGVAQESPAPSGSSKRPTATAEGAPASTPAAPAPTASSTTASSIPTSTSNPAAATVADDTAAIQLALSGMTCASCVHSVEQALAAVAGVVAVDVNFASRNAQVMVDRQRFSARDSYGEAVNALIDAVDWAGYGATEVEDAEQAERLREQRERAEYRQRLRNSWIALGLGGPLMLFGMVHEMSVAGSAERLGWGLVGLLTLGVMIIAGRHFFSGAWKAFRGHNANMDTLIAVGTGSAWLYSMLVVLAPGWLPAEARGLYFEAAAMIIGLINLGQALELKARGRTSQAIKRLLDLRVKTARLLRDGEEIDLPVEQLQTGDLIRVRPGEQLAVDGVVVEGHSLVDESMLTGEPLAISKTAGSELSAGTLNRSGTLVYRATRVGRETALAQIIELVRKAQNSKPPISHLADRISAIFVPSVLIIAVLTALAWFNFGPEPRLVYMLVTACTVLIIACPCALGLATPISTMIGIGKAAEYGILIRNGEALQRASQLQTLVLDKTGTITQGCPQVTGFESFNGYPRDRLLAIARALESRSEHPLAEAVVAFADLEQPPRKVEPAAGPEPRLTSGSAASAGSEPLMLLDFEALTGLGVEARVEAQSVLLGNERLMAQRQIDVSAAGSVAEQWRSAACTVIYLAIDGQLAATLAVADPLKVDAVEAIRRLREDGLRVVMLTGDNAATAAAVAAATGVDDYRAELMPEDKLDYIRDLQRQGLRVGMAGDGINDAPALSQAEVGFAIGSGTDVAIESADVTLMRGSLHGVADAIELSRASLRNIKQNLWAAFLYNSLGIPVAAGVFYPLTGLLLNPVIAGAAMSLSSFTVVSNANRLRLFKPDGNRSRTDSA